MIGIVVLCILCVTSLAASKIYANARVRLLELETQARIHALESDLEKHRLSLESNEKKELNAAVVARDLKLKLQEVREQRRAQLIADGLPPEVAMRALPPIVE